MARITRRERIGLIILLIICAMIILVLAFMRPPTPTPLKAEISEPVEASMSVDSTIVSEPSDSIKHESAKKRERSAKKPKKTPPTPRDHFNEPF